MNNVTKHRFYHPESLTGGSAELSGNEAHHLLNVLRLKPGEEVGLFDGRGTDATARIEQTGRNQVTLTVLSKQPGLAEISPPLILATAIPKGDRFRWLIEKATELGVTRIVPLQTARSVVDPRTTKLDKMRAAIVAASKQCGRSTLLQLDNPIHWDEFFLSDHGGTNIILGHPDGEKWTPSLVVADRPTIIVIGPEGGLTDEEVEQARACGAALIGLGPRILRMETAALSLATLCSNILDRR